jgi:NADH:ubiquinone oxidoreductase subunit C
MTTAIDDTNISQSAFYANFLNERKIKNTSLSNNANGVEMLLISASDWLSACKELKRSCKLEHLNFMTALELKDSYQVIIQLENFLENKQLVLKSNLSKSSPVIASLTELYATANWQEREAYDMLGIVFEGHPNLTRILNPDKWEGYPLRKDYIGPIDQLNQPV